MFAKQVLSTLLFMFVLAAGAYGPHPLSLCPTAPTPVMGTGRLTEAALAADAPRLAFGLSGGVLLADRKTLTGTSFWPMKRLQALSWTPDRSVLLALDGEGGLHAVDAAADRALWSTTVPASDVAGWLFKPDLGLVALSSRTTGLHVFRLVDGAQVDDPGLTSAAFWVDHR